MFIVVNLRFLMINKKISYCINKKETTACSVVTKETIVEPFLAPSGRFATDLNPTFKKDKFLKTLDTIGNCQRVFFSLAVSQHMPIITNL